MFRNKVGSTKKTVVAFGEILWDLLPGGSKLGGAPFNFAYRANSLGNRGIIVSRLGQDDLGRQAWEQVLSLGMDATYIQWDEQYPTGTVQITLDKDNNPDYFIVPDVAYDNTELNEGLFMLAAEADCFCFGTLVQRTHTARRTAEHLLDVATRAVKLLDINLRKNCFSTDTITHSLQAANILKLNEQEALFLASLLDMRHRSLPSFTQKVIEKFSLDYCLVTLGDRGALAASTDNDMVYVPGYKVDLVDPCGSGDAFTAGFIHRLLRRHLLRECCDLGNAMGAMVAAQPGATMVITTEQIEEFMRSQHPRTSDTRFEDFI